MKEIYTSNHMWQLFEHSFIQDMAKVVSVFSASEAAAQSAASSGFFNRNGSSSLADYVTSTLMDIVTTFFRSPFSDQSTALKVAFFLLVMDNICKIIICNQ